MMQKFKAGHYSPKDPIMAVEVERETSESVWINGRRRAKRTEYENYFDTWDDAHAYLIEKAEQKLNAARRALERAQGEHGNIKGIKKPECV